MNTELCASCIHNEVCGKKEGVAAALARVNDLLACDCAKVNVDCKHFKGERTYIFYEDGQGISHNVGLYTKYED